MQEISAGSDVFGEYLAGPVGYLLALEDPVQRLKDFGAPAWIITAMIVLVVLGLFASQIKALQPIFVILERLIGFVRRGERRRQVRLRRHFADYLESQIRLLNNQEEWSDTRFAELEAEVEFEGASRSRLLRIARYGRGVRRARSLSRALEASQERLIILQGDPGSGKSVALRHLAFRLAKRATESHKLASILPVYVNLREWKVAPGEEVDAEAVRRFVIESLNKVNVRDVAKYVEDNFDKGLTEGSWIFFFDSFDEIPEILSSSEEDASLQRYRDALYQFLTGFNKCRGIVASREFRGPSTYGLATFRIAALSAKRRAELIKKAELGYEMRRSIVATLPTAEDAIQQLADNPMFLGLLCEHIRDGGDFPSNSYSVFETYISKRLQRDSSAVEQKFDVTVENLRNIAENAAFTMGVDPTVGLSPTVEQLTAAMRRNGLEDEPQLQAGLSALAYTKLMTSGSGQQNLGSRQVAFSHRRFQEYFATCVVLRDLEVVSPRSLLKDARWRETAVTIFQTQSTEAVRPLVETSIRMLDRHLKSLPVDEDSADPERIWSPGLLHVLGILDAGIVSHSGVASRIEKRVDSVLQVAVDRGGLIDRKWAIDVSGAASQEFQLKLFRLVFKGDSGWLRAAAYRQLGRLHRLPADMADAVRKTLTTMTQGGRLRRDHLSVDAQLRRLGEPAELLRVFHLLRVIPLIDLGLSALFAGMLFGIGRGGHLGPDSAVLLGICALMVHAPSYILRYVSAYSWPKLEILSRQRSEFAGLFAEWFTYIMARVYAPLLTAVPLVLYRDLSRPSDATISLLAILYGVLLLWAPGAFWAARTGRFIKLRWWPFFPVIVLVIGGTVVARGLWRSARRPRALLESLKLLTQAAVATAVLIGFGWAGFKVVSHYHQEDELAFVGLVGFILLLLKSLSFIVRRYARDRILFRRLVKSSASVSPDKFRRQLKLFETRSGRIRYIQLMRRRQVLSSTDETVVALKAMISQPHETGSGSYWSSAVRDELAQLAEEVNRARPAGAMS